MALFEWWSDLPWWLRYGVAAVFLLISTGLYFFGDILWWVVGVVLLLFGGPSGPEKRGYRN